MHIIVYFAVRLLFPWLPHTGERRSSYMDIYQCSLGWIILGTQINVTTNSNGFTVYKYVTVCFKICQAILSQTARNGFSICFKTSSIRFNDFTRSLLHELIPKKTLIFNHRTFVCAGRKMWMLASSYWWWGILLMSAPKTFQIPVAVH